MLDPNSFFVELTESCGAEVLPDGRVKASREQLENCASARGADVTVSHAKNFERNIHVPTISVRRIKIRGKKTETETLFFSFEDQEGTIVTDPAEWGRIPTQIFG
jgi:hypothetical protein